MLREREIAGMDIELSIVMPCLNEAETLATCIEAARKFLARSGVNGEIVIGDNGSTDGSQQIAANLGARVVEIPMHGYGAALHGAIGAARGRYCIMGDSDASYDFEHLDDFLEKLRQGYDLVMGNRFKGGIRPGAMPWKNRLIGNPILSFIGRLFFHSQVGDFHCGLRGFTKHAYDSLDLRTTGMEFASEMVIGAQLKGLRIAEVPTVLSPDGRSHSPHLRPYRDGWRHCDSCSCTARAGCFSSWLLSLYAGSGCQRMVVARAAKDRQDRSRCAHTALRLCIGVARLSACRICHIYQGVRNLRRAFAGRSASQPRLPLHHLGDWAGYRWFAHRIGNRRIDLSVSGWAKDIFGALDPEHMLRIVMPSVFSLTLGVQVVCSSFFLSILGLGRH